MTPFFSFAWVGWNITVTFSRNDRTRTALSAPPANRPCSFASVSIPMVAVWLSGLTEEERDRFQLLRQRFSEVQVSPQKIDERRSVPYERMRSGATVSQKLRQVALPRKLDSRTKKQVNTDWWPSSPIVFLLRVAWIPDSTTESHGRVLWA